MQFILLVEKKHLLWLLELHSLISDEEIVFVETNRMWSGDYLSREWKAARYFKGLSADKRVRFATKAYTGETEASAVHGVLALVFVTLSGICAVSRGVSLGGPGLFWTKVAVGFCLG